MENSGAEQPTVDNWSQISTVKVTNLKKRKPTLEKNLKTLKVFAADGLDLVSEVFSSTTKKSHSKLQNAVM